MHPSCAHVHARISRRATLAAQRMRLSHTSTAHHQRSSMQLSHAAASHTQPCTARHPALRAYQGVLHQLCARAHRTSGPLAAAWQPPLAPSVPLGVRARPCLALSNSRSYVSVPDQHGGAGAAAELGGASLQGRLDQLSGVVSQQLSAEFNLPGLEHNIRTLCPFCKGGSSATPGDRLSFSIRAVEDGEAALYNCFRAKCGRSGRINLGGKHRRGSGAKSQHEEPVRHAFDSPRGQQMLKFFADRGISWEVVSTCGIYSAMATPPDVQGLAASHAGASSSSSSGSSSSSSADASGVPSAAAQGEGDQQPEVAASGQVHCAVAPYRDANGREVSRTYIYLKAVEAREAQLGRTPMQLVRPEGYQGPALGEAFDLVQALAGRGGDGDGAEGVGEEAGGLGQQQEQQEQEQQQQQQQQQWEQEQQASRLPEGDGTQPQAVQDAPPHHKKQRRARSSGASVPGSAGAQRGFSSSPAGHASGDEMSDAGSGAGQGLVAASGQSPSMNTNQELAAYFQSLSEEQAQAVQDPNTTEDVHSMSRKSMANEKVAAQLRMFPKPITLEAEVLKEVRELRGVGPKSVDKIISFLQERFGQQPPQHAPSALTETEAAQQAGNAVQEPQQSLLGEQQGSSPAEVQGEAEAAGEMGAHTQPAVGEMGGHTQAEGQQGLPTEVQQEGKRGLGSAGAQEEGTKQRGRRSRGRSRVGKGGGAEAEAAGAGALQAAEGSNSGVSASTGSSGVSTQGVQGLVDSPGVTGAGEVEAVAQMPPIQHMGPAQASEAANQELVDHLYHLYKERAEREKLDAEVATNLAQAVYIVANFPEHISLDKSVLENLSNSFCYKTLLKDVISFLAPTGPNEALLQKLVHESSQVRGLIQLASYPEKITLDNCNSLSALDGVGPKTVQIVRQTLESELGEESQSAPAQGTSTQPPPADIAAPQQQQPPPHQTTQKAPPGTSAHSGLPGGQENRRRRRGKGTSPRRGYSTQSTSVRDPVKRLHTSRMPPLQAAASASADFVSDAPEDSDADAGAGVGAAAPGSAETGTAAAAAGAAGGADGLDADALDEYRAAVAYVQAGGQPRWHSASSGAERILWGVHDVVSFLNEQVKREEQGRVSADECVVGSGVGSAPLYLYLVEDELDRLTLIQLGLQPHAVVSLPPNVRRDFQALCELQQQRKRETVTQPRMMESSNPSLDAPQAVKRGSKKGTPDPAARALMQSAREILECVTSGSESVFGEPKCGRVYLGLRNTLREPGIKDNGELEEALAGVLNKGRCLRIRWPMTLDELPYCSPHSPDAHASEAASQATDDSAYPTPDGAETEPQPELDPHDPTAPTDTALTASSSHSPTFDVPAHTDPYSSTTTNTGTGTDTNTDSSTRDYHEAPPVPTSPFPHGGSTGSAVSIAFCAPHTPLRLSANEVLVADGLLSLLMVVQFQAKEWPIEGLHEPKDFAQLILQNYHDNQGHSQGSSTGWAALDESYRVVPGELSVVTGIPNSGKSEWLDALCMNLARNEGWSIAMCSFEKSPVGHACSLAEKYTGKPFVKDVVEEDDYGLCVVRMRMSLEELKEGLDFIDRHIVVIRHDAEDKKAIEEREPDSTGAINLMQGFYPASPTIDWVLEKAEKAVGRYNIRGLVIDPYNELHHARIYESETEYVSQMLSKIKRFAQRYSVHVWLVAHPRQLQDFISSKPPNMYDISGSAHFYNKADAGIVVHRMSRGSFEDEFGPDPKLNPTKIFVRKMRNKAAGNQGECVLLYRRANGTYYEPSPEAQDQWSS